MRRLLRPLAAAAVAAAALPLLAPAASATPVACDGMVTPDGRVFAEPLLSVSYLTFAEFACGIATVEAEFGELVEVTTIGTSDGGLPVYDVLLTDESVPGDKPDLLVMSSIHGDEIGAREGAARIIEEMVDPSLLGSEDWVAQVLDAYVIHFVFPNPDGWTNGEIVTNPDDAGFGYTRENDHGQDLNRNFPVKGWFAYEDPDYFRPEGVAVAELMREHDWYLGTDNHGQLNDEYLAAGLQIVGEFDYHKSETLARFADGITTELAAYTSTAPFAAFQAASGGEYAGGYHWGTLYDMLGYSASGSGIDYYNTPDLVGGFGFATELTVGKQLLTNQLTYVPLLNQVWVDTIRGINYVMFKQAIDPVEFTFEVGGRAAYLFDPERIRHNDANGPGYTDDPAGFGQVPYDVSRMKFFEDLNAYASEPLAEVRIGELLDGSIDLDTFDTLVIANDALPEPVEDPGAWTTLLDDWVERGGNLLLTDAALTLLEDLDVGIPEGAVQRTVDYVGSVESFTDRGHPLNAGLRGVASQTFDTVPIGYSFGGSLNSAPNWEVDQAAWEAAGGYTAGTHSSGYVVHGELPVGEGRIRVLGALLPDPTEEGYHPFGLQNYAVTYTGYTLLQNHLVWENPARVEPAAPAPAPAPAEPSAPAPAPLPSTGGGAGLAAVLALGGWQARRRLRREAA